MTDDQSQGNNNYYSCRKRKLPGIIHMGDYLIDDQSQAKELEEMSTIWYLCETIIAM